MNNDSNKINKVACIDFSLRTKLHFKILFSRMESIIISELFVQYNAFTHCTVHACSLLSARTLTLVPLPSEGSSFSSPNESVGSLFLLGQKS